MTKINRAQLEKTIVAGIFLPLLRKYLIDPNSTSIQPSRPNDSWIRSSLPVRTDNSNAQVIDHGKKRNIIKESQKPQYPYVIVQDFEETNEINTIDADLDCHYLVSCALTIRILDVGDTTRVSNLSGQISHLLRENKRSSLLANGLKNIEWDIVSLQGYYRDNSEYFEKQVLITFEVSV